MKVYLAVDVIKKECPACKAHLRLIDDGDQSVFECPLCEAPLKISPISGNIEVYQN